MLALLSYPTLVEPRMALHSQAVAWSWGFAAFAVVCVWAASKAKTGVDPVQNTEGIRAPAPPLADKFLWIGLAACASILLLAVTSHLTQNVAPIPLLWVVPLSLYLLSFILCFESDRLYPRWLFLPLLPVALGVFTWGISLYERNFPIKRLIPALCGALFVCCMVCHGELSRRRPHPRYLTQFYLMVALGGALGGFFVAFVSPASVPRLSGAPCRDGGLRGAGYLGTVEPALPENRAPSGSVLRWRWRRSPSPATWGTPP